MKFCVGDPRTVFTNPALPDFPALTAVSVTDGMYITISANFTVATVATSNHGGT